MDSNSFVLYGNVTEVYDKLASFCGVNGFKIKEPKEKYFAITARKTSLLFWRNLQIELKLMAVEKKTVEVTIIVYKFGKRNPALENEYHITINNFCSNNQ